MLWNLLVTKNKPLVLRLFLSISKNHDTGRSDLLIPIVFFNMPRRYYRRRTIVRAPRKKWGSNLYPFSFNTSGSTLSQYNYAVLVKNSASSSNPTPVILKAGNFKVQGDADFSVTAAGRAELSLYVVYVPEGIGPTDYDSFLNLIKSHPEWILSWKYISANGVGTGDSYQDQSQSYSFSSRLKRNLNSGDQIMLIALVSGVNLDHAHFSGMCQYWTCAN